MGNSSKTRLPHHWITASSVNFLPGEWEHRWSIQEVHLKTSRDRKTYGEFWIPWEMYSIKWNTPEYSFKISEMQETLTVQVNRVLWCILFNRSTFCLTIQNSPHIYGFKLVSPRLIKIRAWIPKCTYTSADFKIKVHQLQYMHHVSFPSSFRRRVRSKSSSRKSRTISEQRRRGGNYERVLSGRSRRMWRNGRRRQSQSGW